jgi:hypothetical protein
MLDRILKVNRHQAYMIFDDGRIVGLYSSDNVDDIIAIVLLPAGRSVTMASWLGSVEDTQVLKAA